MFCSSDLLKFMANDPKVSKAFSLTATISFQTCRAFQILAIRVDIVAAQAQGMMSRVNALLDMADSYAN